MQRQNLESDKDSMTPKGKRKQKCSVTAAHLSQTTLDSMTPERKRKQRSPQNFVG